MGPQRDHRTESDFPASYTQRTIEMQHGQICSEASRAPTTETPLALGASDYVANTQTKSNDSDSKDIEVRHHNRTPMPKSRSTTSLKTGSTPIRYATARGAATRRVP